MVDDAGMEITSSHLSPSLRDYTKENMSKFEEFWKKVTDIHAELGVTCMVQPSLPRIENEDDAKRVCDIFNRAGEITKSAGILWVNFPNIFKKGYEIGILGYYVELEGDRKGRTQFEGVEKSAQYLQNADFVK